MAYQVLAYSYIVSSDLSNTNYRCIVYISFFIYCLVSYPILLIDIICLVTYPVLAIVVYCQVN